MTTVRSSQHLDFKPASPALWQQVSEHREASGSPRTQNSLTSLGAGESRPSKLPSFPQTHLAPKSTLPLSAVTSRSAKRIGNQRSGRCRFAFPLYLVLSCVNDLGPWDQIECQLIRETGNYQPGHVLEWVCFNWKKVQTEEELIIYWCSCKWLGATLPYHEELYYPRVWPSHKLVDFWFRPSKTHTLRNNENARRRNFPKKDDK